ncbi:MAG: hypothetical protein IJX72_06915 [Clostridia bacterium]|nr:hypothetical protein [Clostridia bacterium]
MKTNKEKMNDAVGMLDEETVQSAMTHATTMRTVQISRRATMRRRAVVLLAACLSLALMLGVLLAVPLMTANDPGVTDTTGQGTSANETADEVGDYFYTEVPLVRITQLSTSSGSEAIETPMITRSFIPQMDAIHGFIQPFIVMSFDCEEGETVTVNAGVDSLHLVSLPFTEDTDLSMAGAFMDHLIDIYNINEPGSRTLTIDPSTSCILVDMPLTRTALDEDTMTFTVTGQDGTTVGAGSIYLGTRYLLDVEVHRLWYESCTLTRSAILGSVRFNTPEDVTDEQVSELLDSFATKAEEAKAELDYTPATMEEGFTAARAEIAKTVFAGEQIHGSSCSKSTFEYFQTISVSRTDKSERDRAFLIFADGTWGEYRVHEDCIFADCHGNSCPMGEAGDSHHALMPGCRITFLDGRIFEIAEQEIDGKMMYVPVQITKTAD